MAIVVDLMDEVSRKAGERGVHLEERLTALAGLLVQVSEPQNIAALKELIARLPLLAQGMAMVDELPNLLATVMDVLDEWAAKLKQEGISLDESLRRALHAGLYLGGQIREEELDRIGYLLKSEVMSQNAVETVGLAGAALTRCRQGTCDQPVPPRVGLLGMLKALQDPSTQRAVSFGLQFAKCFGNALNDSHPRS